MIRTLAAALATSTCIFALATPAASQTKEYNIPAGPLKDVLDAYVAQSGQQVIYRANQVRLVQSSGVRGELPPEAALATLLAGTGFTTRTDGSLIAIMKSGNGADLELAGAQMANAEEGTGASENEGAIVVTARKRVEGIQDVPMAVSVLGGEAMALQGISDTTDLYARVPGLFASYGGGQVPTSDFQYIAIRGVGFNAGLEPATGIFVDGMYSPQLGSDTAFLDVERIEVLRGPQGTLFGRNTQAGAVNIVTRKPSDIFRGSTQVEYSRFDTRKVNVSLNGPFSDTLFGGVSAAYAKTDGYITNAITGKSENPSERVAARASFVWKATDKLEAQLIGDVSLEDYNEIGFGVPYLSRGFTSTSDPLDDDSKKSSGIQLNVTYDLNDNLSLKSITGTRRSKSDVTVDRDGIPDDGSILIFPVPAGTPLVYGNEVAVQGVRQAQRVSQRFISQELRLEGSNELGQVKVDWLVGGYYFDQRQHQEREFDIGPGAVTVLPPLMIREEFDDYRDGYAFFGQSSVRPIRPLEFTFGARYSYEQVDAVRNRLLTTYRNGTFSNSPVDETAYKDFDNISFMGSVAYDLTRDALAYFTFSQGWKAGGLQRYPSRQGQTLPFGEERSNNFEVGLKSSFFDKRLTANITAFLVKIRGQQLTTVVDDPNGGTPIRIVTNIGKSRSRGVEAEIFFAPTDSLSLSANIAYADTEFLDAEREGASLNGLDFEDVPELTSQQVVTYKRPFNDDWGMEFVANGLYVGSYKVQDRYQGASGDAQLPIDAYYRLNLSASLYNDDGWRFTFFVNNVLNSYDYKFMTRNFLVSSPLSDDQLFVQPLQPRVFGGRIRKSF